MKITKEKLKQIIKEEISKAISADDLYLAEMFVTGTSGLEEKCRDAGGQMMANQCVGADGKPIKLQEEEIGLAEQTVGPDRWEEIFAGVISDKWWMAYNAATKNQKTRAAAMARKKLEEAIIESKALKTVADLIASIEEGLKVTEVDSPGETSMNEARGSREKVKKLILRRAINYQKKHYGHETQATPFGAPGWEDSVESAVDDFMIDYPEAKDLAFEVGEELLGVEDPPAMNF